MIRRQFDKGKRGERGKGSSGRGGSRGGSGRGRGGEGRMGQRGEGFIRGPGFRVAFCRFCKDKSKLIEYKNLAVLEKMISERGKILSRRFTGNCAKHQRRVSSAVKRARFLSLLPYAR